MRLTTKIILCFLVLSIFFVACKQDSKTVAQKKISKKIMYSDEAILDTIQFQTFNYFWEGAEPNSGLARERLHMDDLYPTSPKNTVTTGGSGFGLMAILVGIERGFITRQQALEHYERAVDF